MDRFPVVHFAMVIKSGSASDPDGKEGLAWFTANLLKRGSKSYNREQIEEGLEDIGGELDIRVEREVIVITGKTLRDNLDKYYAIFSDIIFNPDFPADEVANLRTDQEQAIRNIVRDDARLCHEAFLYELYAGHPYAHPVQGYLTSAADLTADDAKRFYKKHFVKGNAICGLAGMYSPEFEKQFKNDMNKLKWGSVPDDERVIVRPGEMRVMLVEKPGRDQSQIRMGKLVDYTRRDSIWYTYLAANTYLGQHRESFGKLYTTIRSERGLSYGAYSYPEHFRQSGWSKNPMPLTPFDPQYFSMWTYPKRINTEFSIKMAKHELDQILRYGIDPGELQRFVSFQINHFPFLIETAEQRLLMEMEEIYYNQPDFIENFENNLQAVSHANISDVLDRNWSSDDILIVV
ncbi:MAG: insulinase family protein, partial [candidate division Zixibacteria bacterium]|nr:insulinase family protein [candidate division Zixibacteria bacterium]NIS17499.1 insulinase family protein [candidate division Zixibacteria bacterium]NIS49205.1 insulinase family protein [candidate division Zixibacteria bacterium]NIT53808.1 insulinase family protein [candidate division Zixibacteria bacterium]NIU17312.1 insulinase family protein [candidate division Zixibacteria bacterium]